MTRSKKQRSHRRRSHHNPARDRRRSRRRYHRNPEFGGLAEALMAGAASVAAFAFVRKGGQLVANHLLASIPQPDLVAESALAAALVMLAPSFIKKPDLKVGLMSGAVAAALISLIDMTPLGPTLALEKVVMLPAPAPAAASMSGELRGELRGELSAESEAEVYD
ncbi:MAG: hypothetical protein KGO96_13770 [Elusimicrobia bacterium]|nr:hypothetical protein [Elusimicrobiota bacterium]